VLIAAPRGVGQPRSECTLAALRAIVHSLRGWPTPLGAAINTAATAREDDRRRVGFQLETIGAEVVEFALSRRGEMAKR